MTNFVRTVEQLLLVDLRQISQQSLVVSLSPPLTSVFSLLIKDVVDFPDIILLRSVTISSLKHELFDLFELTG